MTAKKVTRKPAPKKVHKITNKVPSLGGAEVNIKQVDNGYVVKAGCKTLVVNSAKVLCEALQDYLERPEEYEKALEDEEEEDQRPLLSHLPATSTRAVYNNMFNLLYPDA